MANEFGKKLQELREACGFSRSSFAAVTELHRETIRQYELGTILPMPVGLEQLLGYLAVPSSEKQALRAAFDLARKRRVELEFDASLLTPEQKQELLLSKVDVIIDAVADFIPNSNNPDNRAMLTERVKNALLRKN